MAVPLIAGREFDERDRFPFTDAGRMPTIVVVNRSFAKRFFGTQPAIGRHVGIGEERRALGIESVGVVEDSLLAGPRNGVEPQVFFSFLQANFPVSATFYVRTTIEPAAPVPALRRVVATLDPTRQCSG
jgi:putative ABC transport system permease protein